MSDDLDEKAESFLRKFDTRSYETGMMLAYLVALAGGKSRLPGFKALENHAWKTAEMIMGVCQEEEEADEDALALAEALRRSAAKAQD